MSDPNAPRPEDHDPLRRDDADQPVEGFSVTDEQHAAPSAPGVGEPAQSFSSPAVDPAQAPGQPAFGEPAGGATDAGQDWQHGQHPGAGQPSSAPYGAPQPGHSPYSAPQPGAPVQQHEPYGQSQGQAYGAPGQQHGQPAYGQPQHGQSAPHHGAQHGQPPYGQSQHGQPQYGAPGQPQYAASAPMSPVDEKNAGMWGHLSGLSTIVTGGYGGWIGPLIVYLIYKDRSAFARQESKEALNFGIFMTILTIGLIILGTILTVVGIGLLLLALWWVPGLLQVIFSIIGAMRVNNGGSYRYPFNWRLVK